MTVDAFGARTVSSVIRTPLGSTSPRIRTIGNGVSNRVGTLEGPTETTCGPFGATTGDVGVGVGVVGVGVGVGVLDAGGGGGGGGGSVSSLSPVDEHPGSAPKSTF
ncbi:MAG: hypothetical protein M3N47_05235 [Chloroflexota bacterium]|nr:hypothetical protein [Chloroflexota bacterium]